MKKVRIESLGRRGLRRTFDHDVLGRLSLIALGQMAGFSLDEIGAMFGRNQPAQVDRALLSEKAEELARTIRQLSALKNGLNHATLCPAPRPIEFPQFHRLLANDPGRAHSRGQLTRRESPHP